MSIHERVAKATRVPAGDMDHSFFDQQFAPAYGLREIPDAMVSMNPYFLAFSLGRRAQLGVDRDRLAKALADVTHEQLERCAEQVFAPDRGVAVSVRVGKVKPEKKQ